MIQKKVLIVDDDPSVRDAFRLIFERAGYATTILSGGNPILAEAFEVPDIFILDKQLSGVDGLDVCRFLKQQASTRHVPVVIVSATPHVSKLAEDALADDFLEKPFKMKDLLTMVEKHLAVTE